MSNAFSQSDLVLGIKTGASQLPLAFVLIVFYDYYGGGGVSEGSVDDLASL